MTDSKENSAVSNFSSEPTSRENADLHKISQLDISEKWREKFRLIVKAGGPKLKNYKSLSLSERTKVSTNILAFLLWPVYLPIKGLWRQAISYFLIAIAIIAFMHALGLDRFTRAVGYGVSGYVMFRANIAFFQKKVLGEITWL